jgi:hypothetical protein
VTIAIAYPQPACVLTEQIFIMPEVKVNAKKGCFMRLSRGSTRHMLMMEGHALSWPHIN